MTIKIMKEDEMAQGTKTKNKGQIVIRRQLH